ncbi:MAG: TonB family protein [Betaproteobacteria bacterium]|nr:TonB family protein [Betaproteobacteria bacterium]
MRARIVVALLLVCCAGHAFAQQRGFVWQRKDGFFTFDWHKQGQPQIAVRPAYPDSELPMKASGYVDTEITVNNGGELQEIRSLRSDPPRPAFEAAVREALELWQFFVFVDSECNPVAASGKYRFVFQVKDDAGKVTMQRLDEAAKPADGKVSGAQWLEWTNRNDVISSIPYPPIAWRQRAEAELILRFHVDTKTAQVVDAKLVAGRSNHQELLPLFAPGAERAGRNAIFQIKGTPTLPVATYCSFVSMHAN